MPQKTSPKKNVCKMSQGDANATADEHTATDRTAATRGERTERLTANRSGISPQVKGSRKEMNDPAGTTTNRNDGPTGTTHGQLQMQESSKANSNGGSRVGGSACKDQALIASVKMRKQVRYNHSFISLPPTQDRAATLDAHSVQLPKNLLSSSLAQGTLRK
ncbi:hypothetical protein NDU88_004221 [Pleurodeles waltl]|uniref:Uncharacterized protein n=1 Tax=Pleurodeles waltl TaxID=8319 RepID=A0AAV7UEN3_PLEWA|nr:hypothetical protein NDU88_004221 [Pleurodeles waltl]